MLATATCGRKCKTRKFTHNLQRAEIMSRWFTATKWIVSTFAEKRM
jgi:hypothetical protein